jgi:hypothetical protein
MTPVERRVEIRLEPCASIKDAVASASRAIRRQGDNRIDLMVPS